MEPASSIARSGVGRLTTVARTRIAHSLPGGGAARRPSSRRCRRRCPARCSVIIGKLSDGARAPGVPPPDTTGTADPGALEQLQRALEELGVSGAVFGKVIRPSNCIRGRSMARRASSSAASGVCTPLRPKPVSHSTRNRTSAPCRTRGLATARARPPRCPGPPRGAPIRLISAISRSVLASPRML